VGRQRVNVCSTNKSVRGGLLIIVDLLLLTGNDDHFSALVVQCGRFGGDDYGKLALVKLGPALGPAAVLARLAEPSPAPTVLPPRNQSGLAPK